MQVDLLLLLLFVLLLAVVLLILGVFLLQSHEVGLEEVVLPSHVLDIFEVALQLLGELFNSQQLLALLRCLQLSLRHQLYISIIISSNQATSSISLSIIMHDDGKRGMLV